MARRKRIIPHKPKSVLRKATIHDITPVLSYKLTEIIGIEDMSLHTNCGEGARPAAFANAIFIGVISAAVKENRERSTPVDGVAGAVDYSSGVEGDPTLGERRPTSQYPCPCSSRTLPRNMRYTKTK